MGAIGLAIVFAAAGQIADAIWVLFFAGLAMAGPIRRFVSRKEGAVGDPQFENALIVSTGLAAAFILAAIATMLGLIGHHRWSAGIYVLVAALFIFANIRTQRRYKKVNSASKDEDRDAGRVR